MRRVLGGNKTMTDGAIGRLTSALTGRYSIERKLGAGGMATVYLAHDLKHDRKVALKVLRPELAAVMGADRFLAEIKTTANLQHPHILPLFDSGQADGFLFFVMPYVEGESLRDRLDREGELPVEQAVRIATAVASALDYAHRHGVIHRDIKPANILLHDGQPLVADFGIALAVSAAGGGRLTETGLSLGTPYYMSPEQATAERDPDSRSDVYALGCVLYEMLVGEPPYTGSSAQAVLGKILATDPVRPTEHRRAIPAHVEATVLKALEKRPADRFGSAGEFGRALAEEGAVGISASHRRRPGEYGEPRRTGRGWAAVASIAAVGLLALSLWQLASKEAGDPPLRRWALTLPDSIPLVFVGATPAGLGRTSLALSPGSEHLVYVGRYHGSTRLFLRDSQTGETRELPGTEGAFGPFLSPDGSSVAFFVGNELRKVSLAGGPALTVAAIEAMNPVAGVWKKDGRMVVTADGCIILSVPEAGGIPVQAHAPHACPWDITDIPDSDLILGSTQYGLSVASVSGDRELGISLRGTHPLPGPWTDPLIADDPRLLPNGYLTFVSRDGTLMGVRFDPRRFEATGAPVALIDGVRREGHWGSAQYSFSEDGTLVYAPGDNALYGQLVWVDREGQTDSLPIPPGAFGPFAISPDASRLLLIRERNAGPQELWLHELQRGNTSRVFSANDAAVWTAIWAHNAPWYVASAERLGVGGYTATRVWVDGSHPPDTMEVHGPVSSVSPDDRWMTVDAWPGGDVWVMPAGPEGGDDARFTDDAGGETFSAFSPDGKWIAYTADRDGKMEVYVEAFPKDGRVFTVSSAGGEEPVWSPAEDRLFYRKGNRFLAVDFTVEDGVIRFESPTVFAEGPYVNLPGLSYTVSPDGQSLLLVRGTEEATTKELVVITGWFAEVKRRVESGTNR
jgi:serine/threonine-protein kinase